MDCPSCAAANPEGKKFCGECGSALPRCCPTCGRDNPVDNNFCGDCGARLIGEVPAAPLEQPSSPAPSEAERRQVTVMFVDLVGSTALSAKLDPEDMSQVIRAYQHCCAEAVKRWDGHIAKYMGDGVLALFGYPQAHEDDPERAVRAGLDITAAVARLKADNAALAARIGIATGQVVVGELVGEGTAQEQSVVGETPNLAARLQALAEPGTVIVAAGTRRLLGDLFELVDLGPTSLKGFVEPLAAFRVVGEGRAQGRFEALRGQRATPLIGRDDELHLLARRWRRANTGEGQVVLIAGDPGIGKSRLCVALRERIADQPHTRLAYQCSAHHGDAAFYPVTRQLESAAGIRPEHDPTEKLDRLKTMLGYENDELAWAEHVSLLAILLSIPPDTHDPISKLGAQQLTERLYLTLIQQLERLAAERPVLVVFEDLHWADPSTLEMLDRLVERVATLRVLVLLTARPGFAASWTDRAHVVLLTLTELPGARAMR